MDPRLQRRVQRYGWDKAAEAYHAYQQAALAPAQRTLLERADLSPGEAVLDVACGSGLVSSPAARAVGPTGQLVGIDISDKMIELARTLASQEGLSNATFQRQDAEELDHPDASYDVVLCALGLMYVPDPGRAVAHLHRVLKPGGRVLTLVWGERRNCGWAEIFPIVDARVASEVCPLFFSLGTGDNLQKLFEAAGLEHVEAERFAYPAKYPTEEITVAAAFQGGPVALAYSRFDRATKEEVHGEYLASIAAYRKGEGHLIPGEFLIVSGRHG